MNQTLLHSELGRERRRELLTEAGNRRGVRALQAPRPEPRRAVPSPRGRAALATAARAMDPRTAH